MADRPPLSSLDEGAGTVTVDGRWVYHYGAHRRPFIHPLRTPAGHVLSCDAPADHPWHHGLWFTVKFVNRENFWEEVESYGVLRHRTPPDVVEEADIGDVIVRGSLEWILPDRTTVVITEQRQWTYRPLAPDAYAIDLVTRLSAATDLILDREPFNGLWGGYGGLAFRGRPDWSDTQLMLADGTVSDRFEGVAGDWVDLSGPIDGGAGGVALFDAPGNPCTPVPWYATTRGEVYGDGWGNFVNAAFLWDGPIPLNRSERLTLRHRVIVHDGIWGMERLATEYESYRRELAGVSRP